MTHTQAKIRELVCERIAACYREITEAQDRLEATLADNRAHPDHWSVAGDAGRTLELLQRVNNKER